MTTPYSILDVPPDADGAAVKRAYRRKAAETHPDKGGSEEAFTEVAGAWMILRDPDRRARKTSVANSQGAAAQLKKIESARRRLSFKGKGGDFIAAMLNDKIFTIRKTIGNLDREQDACDGALLYVEDYIYAVDAREPEPWGNIPTRMSV